MLQLMESGTIQAKLRVSQPGDPDEVEADRAAEKVVSTSRAPAIQRKCACGGGAPCSKCSGEQEETIHRSVATPQLRALQPSIQRAPADPSSSPATTPVPAAPEKEPAPGAKPAALIVEDNATKIEPSQMRKSQFIALLRTEACAVADAALASVNHTTKGCPYVAKWLSFYEKQSSQHIEQAVRKYAPEAAMARSAREAIGAIVRHVERAAIIWAKTGTVVGVPREFASQVSGPGEAGSGSASSEVGGTNKQQPPIGGGVQRKARDGGAAPAHDAANVKSQLGGGNALDSRMQSKMSSAFGQDFSGVRVHTDGSAAKLSSDLQARAFTLGNDVAFASGEYRPGTLIGDALIAHELAHVVQQSGGKEASVPQMKGDGNYDALETDADVSAIGAVAALWTGTKGKLADIGRNAAPRLKSGLRLQRCQEVEKVCPKGYSWRVQNTTGLGSFGCMCNWKCMPGEDPREVPYEPQSTVQCDPNYYCDTGKKREELDSSYTKTGYGAAMTPPPPADAYCGCFPLNKDGKKVSDAPLKKTDFEMTDVLGPLADMAAAAKSRAKPKLDPTTGRAIPGKSVPEVEHDAKPSVVAVGDLGVDVAVGNARVADYREKFDIGKGRNVAFADYNVANKNGTLVSASGKAEREGTVPVPASPELPTLIVGHTREFDSEKKILEHLITTIGDNPEATGTISLYSERSVCAGCDLAIAAFRAKYPKIDLRVVSGRK